MSFLYFDYDSDPMLACPCCGQMGMDEEFMHKLDGLRGSVGFPLVISSGYRCPSYNAMLSTTGAEGPHTTGRAVDIQLSGPGVYWIIEKALRRGFTGIGLKQNGTLKKRFLHLDDLGAGFPRPRIWTY